MTSTAVANAWCVTFCNTNRIFHRIYLSGHCTTCKQNRSRYIVDCVDLMQSCTQTRINNLNSERCLFEYSWVGSKFASECRSVCSDLVDLVTQNCELSCWAVELKFGQTNARSVLRNWNLVCFTTHWWVAISWRDSITPICECCSTWWVALLGIPNFKSDVRRCWIDRDRSGSSDARVFNLDPKWRKTVKLSVGIAVQNKLISLDEVVACQACVCASDHSEHIGCLIEVQDGANTATTSCSREMQIRNWVATIWFLF